MPDRCTAKQAQYVAFIYSHTVIHGRPPAEAEMERSFETLPPVRRAGGPPNPPARTE